MKKSNYKSKNKTIILVNLFLIAILMVVGVYAWFAASADNRVDAYEIEVNANNNLELSFDEDHWHESLNLADYTDENGNSFSDINFVEITSNGNTIFQIPQLTQNDNYATVNTDVDWVTAEENKDYLKFKVYMRSKDKLNVYLGNGSKATPKSDVITGENSGNKSSYGDFSKDCIVGALRVSVKDNNDKFKYIWITNPELHLNNTVGSDVYTMTTNAVSSSNTNGDGTEGNNYQWNNSYSHRYYNTNKALATVLKSSTVTTDLPDTSSTTEPAAKYKIASLTGTPDENGFYTAYATFNVWIEGCDTEARRALVGGKFNLSLNIDAYLAE